MSERHGSLGEEAVRLVDAVSQRLRGGTLGNAAFGGGSFGGGTFGGGDDVWGEVTDRVSTKEATSPECRICPFCQGLGLIRHARPEAFAHLLSAGESFAAAMRDLIDTHERHQRGDSHRRSSGVEHIDIG